jgi:hypothetical protein
MLLHSSFAASEYVRSCTFTITSICIFHGRRSRKHNLEFSTIGKLKIQVLSELCFPQLPSLLASIRPVWAYDDNDSKNVERKIDSMDFNMHVDVEDTNLVKHRYKMNVLYILLIVVYCQGMIKRILVIQPSLLPLPISGLCRQQITYHCILIDQKTSPASDSTPSYQPNPCTRTLPYPYRRLCNILRSRQHIHIDTSLH